jgi:hypothetical protein
VTVEILMLKPFAPISINNKPTKTKRAGNH